MLLLAGCEENENAGINTPSAIVAVGHSPQEVTEQSALPVDRGIVFTGEDILWFNKETREIKFKDMSSPFNTIPMYNEIQFELSGEVLFKAITWACGINNQIFDDLVLYYDLENEKFYLHDSYPEHILTELAKENKEKRAGAWKKFVDQLRTEGRLKE